MADWTQADIDALKAEIAKNGSVQAISFSDQSTTFYPLQERLALLEQMEQAVAAAAGEPKHIRYVATSKGT